VSAPSVEVELATREDEPELRRLLRENPMQGNVRLSLEREPDAFVAASAEGHPHHVVVARDPAKTGLVGMGHRAVMDVFLNGAPARVGYLSQLRVDGAYRGRRRLLARGYALLASGRAPGEEPFDLTSILADNAPALRLLGAGVPGLPRYRLLARFTTVVIPTSSRRSRRRFVPVETARPEHLLEIARCLERNAKRFQLARRWSAPDLISPDRCPGLRVEDFRLAFGGDGRLLGAAALWDQSAFKQVVVRGYSPALARWRPWINRGASLVGAPRLPEAGTIVRQAFLSHVAVDGDDPGVFEGLLQGILDDARQAGLSYLVAGFAEGHTLLAVARRRSWAREQASLLHVVHAEDGASAASRLDDRVPHAEVALL
jgi:hypothetical protein